MKMPYFVPVALLLVFATSGCVMYTSVKTEARQSVQFSSALAAQSFYDAYLAAASPTGHGSISIYLPPPYWHRTVPTDNIRFNAAIQSADVDHDGVISDEEAVAYAAKAQNPANQKAKS